MTELLLDSDPTGEQRHFAEAGGELRAATCSASSTTSSTSKIGSGHLELEPGRVRAGRHARDHAGDVRLGPPRRRAWSRSPTCPPRPAAACAATFRLRRWWATCSTTQSNSPSTARSWCAPPCSVPDAATAGYASASGHRRWHPAPAQERSSEQFSQLDGSTTRASSAAPGWGLAICRRPRRSHGRYDRRAQRTGYSASFQCRERTRLPRVRAPPSPASLRRRLDGVPRWWWMNNATNREISSVAGGWDMQVAPPSGRARAARACFARPDASLPARHHSTCMPADGRPDPRRRDPRQPGPRRYPAGGADLELRRRASVRERRRPASCAAYKPIRRGRTERGDSAGPCAARATPPPRAPACPPWLRSSAGCLLAEDNLVNQQVGEAMLAAGPLAVQVRGGRRGRRYA